MAHDTTILGGDVKVWYLSNNRTKMMDWGGAATGTRTMNELYSAMADLLDESSTIDDGTAFNADTPTEYTVGTIDRNDNDPWYVTFNLMEHITGGSLKTDGWTRTEGTDTGIVIVPGTNVNIVAGDVGLDISGGTDGNGTLLEVIEGSKGDFLVIRPDSNAAGDSFKGNGQTLTCNTHTFTQHATEDNNTGEMIWANIYSIGTIDSNVHCYVYQGEFDADTPASPATDNSERVLSVNSSTLDYWGQGHIDRCVPIKDWARLASAGAWDVIDDGYLRVFARKGGDLYSSFEVANSTTSGGRNPVPLQTAVDLNQGTGTKTISFTGSITGTFEDGEVIEGGTSNGRGILDLTNSNTSAGGYLSYFPIAEDTNGGALTAMQSGETITGDDSGATCTTDGAPANAGPALASWFTNNAFPALTIGESNFTGHNADIDNDGTDENYGILVDCNSNTLAEVYEWLKYICQYTQGDEDAVEDAFETDILQSNIFGEEFVGGTAYFGYSAISGTIADGEGVTQATTGATGYIISHDTGADVVLLRNTRGTFSGTYQIDSDVDADYFTPDETGNFAASTSSPFGTFAGGTFFGARGILIKNWLAADENSFILTDIEGNTNERPTSVVIKVSNVWGNAATNGDADLVAVYPLTGSGGDIDKDPTDAVYAMNCDGGEAAGSATLAVDSIPTWAPSSGRLVLVDNSDANQEFVIRYSSFDSGTDTYTYANTASTCTAGTNATTLIDSGASFTTTAQRGDLVWSSNHSTDWAYVVSVDSDTQLTIGGGGDSDGITGLVSTDAYELNCNPVAVTASDDAYNCVLHTYPTSNEASASIIYPGSQFYFRVKVRNTRETDLTNGPIKPYSSDGSTTGTDQEIQTVRTIDTVYS